jgi:hypothetical protein
LHSFHALDIFKVWGFFMVVTKSKTETLDIGIDGECPICAKLRDPETGALPYNAVTLAAMQEARDIASGKIPGKWYHSLDEALEDI